MIFFYGEIF